VDETKPKAKHAPKEGNRRSVIGPHAAAALRLLIFTGARLREILHLKWDHVDFERGLLMLPTSKTGKKTIVLNAPALLLGKSSSMFALPPNCIRIFCDFLSPRAWDDSCWLAYASPQQCRQANRRPAP
jgi:integrase-like protein